MSVHTLPLTDQRKRDIRAALDVADKALYELLRQAVAAYRTGDVRAVGSFSQRHHKAIAFAYLDSVAIILDKDGLATELKQYMDLGVYDIRRLAGIARDWDGTPPPLAA